MKWFERLFSLFFGKTYWRGMKASVSIKGFDGTDSIRVLPSEVTMVTRISVIYKHQATRVIRGQEELLVKNTMTGNAIWIPKPVAEELLIQFRKSERNE